MKVCTEQLNFRDHDHQHSCKAVAAATFESYKVLLHQCSLARSTRSMRNLDLGACDIAASLRMRCLHTNAHVRLGKMAERFAALGGRGPRACCPN